MGSDYASGYNIGIKERDTSSSSATSGESPNISDMYANRSPAMGGHIALKSGVPTALEIRDAAREEALSRKSKELDIQSQEIANREAQLQSARNTEDARMRIAKGDQALYGIQDDRRIAGIAKAEGDADKWRGIAEGEAQGAEDDAIKDAMRGMYIGDSAAVKEYFDRFGESGISIEGVTKGPEGQLTVNFSEGKSQTFASPQEAIEKLLLPAETIRRSQDQQLDAKTTATHKANAIKAWQKESIDPQTGELLEGAMDRDQYIANYMQSVTGKGPAGGIQGRPEDYAPGEVTPARGQINQPVKVEKSKKTGDIRYTYADGRTEIKSASAGGLRESDTNFMEYTDANTNKKMRIKIEDGEVVKYEMNESGDWVLSSGTDPTKSNIGQQGIQPAKGSRFKSVSSQSKR